MQGISVSLGAEISKYYRRNDTADLTWEVDHEFDREDRYA